MFKIFDFPNLSRKLFFISEIELVFYNNLLNNYYINLIILIYLIILII